MVAPMSKAIIRLGDPTDHGGAVVSVSATHHTVDGIPVARVGDRCSCPRRGHNNCVIVEGDPAYTVDGIPVNLPDVRTSNGVIHVIGGVLLP